MLARERLIEIVASVAGVGVMVVLLYVIGTAHAEEANDHQVLSPTGGELVVYSIVAFVVVMTLVGIVLIYTVTVVEAENDDGATNSDGDSNSA